MNILNLWNQVISDTSKNNFGQHIDVDDVNGCRKTIGSVTRDAAELIKTAQAQNLTKVSSICATIGIAIKREGGA